MCEDGFPEKRNVVIPYSSAEGKSGLNDSQSDKIEPQNRRAGKRDMTKRKRYPLGTFLKQFSTEVQCQKYLASLRWKAGNT